MGLRYCSVDSFFVYLRKESMIKLQDMITSFVNTNILITALLAMVVVLGAVCLWQWRKMRRLEHVLVRFIKENLKYKYHRYGGLLNTMI